MAGMNKRDVAVLLTGFAFGMIFSLAAILFFRH
jgi:hypothetical protein